MATTSENIEFFKSLQDSKNIVNGGGLAFSIDAALSELGDANNITQYPGLPNRLPTKVERLHTRYLEVLGQLEE